MTTKKFPTPIVLKRKYHKGSVPSLQEFPYKHNYDAVFGYDGKGSGGDPGKHGGHRINDSATGIDSRGIFYKKETEEQRLERFEKKLRQEQFLKDQQEWYKGNTRKLTFGKHYTTKVDTQYGGLRVKDDMPKGWKRYQDKTGMWRTEKEYKPVNRRRLKDWIVNAEAGRMFEKSPSVSKFAKKDDPRYKIISAEAEEIAFINHQKVLENQKKKYKNWDIDEYMREAKKGNSNY
jgi:hypothetical protein